MATRDGNDNELKESSRPDQIERFASHIEDDTLKQQLQNIDEFGAHKKTDPAEIALVRRMDWFILVS